MPGRGTEPGPALYPECGKAAGPRRHRREKTRTCRGCRAVQRQEMARYRVQRIVVGPRLVSTLGLRRRVRALATRGWGQAEIAERIGMARTSFSKIVNQDEVRREVHDKVKALYFELWFRDGPNYLARCNAERQGWPGPVDWDDPDNPDEIPICEIERAHREAKEMDRAWRKRQARRPDLRLVEGGRQSGADGSAQLKAAMAT